MTQIEKLRFIRDHLSEEDILCQLAEEAAELAQAALKLRRAITGTNPTPVSEDAAIDDLFTELADVMLAEQAFFELHANDSRYPTIPNYYIQTIADVKLDRWVKRLEGRDGQT